MSVFGGLLAVYRELRARHMSRCRTCGLRDDVISYDPRGLWAYFFRQTYCPEHCPDHIYVYERGWGSYCDNCGQEPPLDYYKD